MPLQTYLGVDLASSSEARPNRHALANLGHPC